MTAPSQAEMEQSYLVDVSGWWLLALLAALLLIWVWRDWRRRQLWRAERRSRSRRHADVDVLLAAQRRRRQ